MLPRVGRAIRHERVHLGRRRRQADHIEVGAAYQGVAIGPRRGLQSMLLTRSFKKPIDRIGEARVVGHRERRLHRQLERPIVPLLRGDETVLQRGERGGGRRLRARRQGRIPCRALIDPFLDRRDLPGRQRRPLRRHRRFLEPGDAAIHAAPVGVARDEVRSARAALQRALAAAEVELAHLHGIAVARQAVVLENRLNVCRERNRRCGRRGTGLRSQERADRTGDKKGERDRRETALHRQCLAFVDLADLNRSGVIPPHEFQIPNSYFVIICFPSIYGRSAVGTTTDPSFCW